MLNCEPLAFFYCDSNNLKAAQQHTSFFSSTYTSHPKTATYTSGLFMFPTNPNGNRRIISFFCVRRLSEFDWTTNHDVYLKD